MATSTTPRRKKGVNIGHRIVHGSLLSSEFFRRYWLQVLLVVVMILVYITNKYQCQTATATILQLQKELAVASTEHIHQKSRYMSEIRESRMQQRVDSLHLGLAAQEQPPVHITYAK